MTPTVPPFVAVVSTSRYVVQQGDTHETIAELFGLSGCAYGELVGANLERGLTAEGVAPGYPLKLARLSPGDRLKLPIDWLPGGFGLAGGAVNPGEDNALDAVGLAIAEHIHLMTGDNDKGLGFVIAESDVQAYFNAISQWYRADNGPSAPKPDWNQIRPYLIAARSWMQTGGAKMQKVDRDHLAWSSFPWWDAGDDFRALRLRQPDWSLVRDWANQHIKPGMVQPKPSSRPAGYAGAWKAQTFSNEPFASVPWGLPFSQIPAWAIPWGYLKPKRLLALPETATPAQCAAALIADLALAIGLPSEEPGPVGLPKEKTDVAPGGRPPFGPRRRSTGRGRAPGDGGTEAGGAKPQAGRAVGWYVAAGAGALVLTALGWRALNPPRKRTE